jgi:DNA polymerase III epsilon subunit
MLNKMIVMDGETTGFSADADRLIEFGAAEFNPETGELGETLHFLVNPGIAVPEKITALTGITTAQLLDKPPFSAVAPQIAEFLRGNTLVAHNAPFDTSFLTAEFKRAKIKGSFEKVPKKIICTRRLARYGRPNLKADMDSLLDAFGIDRSIRTTHSALIDCFLLAQLYPHLAKLQAARDAVLSNLLPFTPGADLPDDRDFLGKSYVMMSELVNRIKAEQERIREKLASILDGKGVETPDYEVSFGLPGISTDWKKVTAAFLQDKDLKPYQKPTAASMKIESA